MEQPSDDEIQNDKIYDAIESVHCSKSKTIKKERTWKISKCRGYFAFGHLLRFNFEWSEGYRPRFGNCTRRDYKTLKRTFEVFLALWYKQLIQFNQTKISVKHFEFKILRGWINKLLIDSYQYSPLGFKINHLKPVVFLLLFIFVNKSSPSYFRPDKLLPFPIFIFGFFKPFHYFFRKPIRPASFFPAFCKIPPSLSNKYLVEITFLM